MQEIDIFIFRRDLRVHDNLAFNTLIQSSDCKLLPIFIFNPKQIYAKHNPYFSNHAVQFMIESLVDLEKHLHINYFEGDDIHILDNIRHIYKIRHIAFNTDYTPFAIRRDATIQQWCQKHNIELITEEDYTLFKIGSVLNKSGKPYQVYTPFYKATQPLKQLKPQRSLAKKIPEVIKMITKFDKNMYYVPNPHIAVHGGRENALVRLKHKMQNYAKDRDIPSLDGTTKLSAYIKFGCVSIREVYDTYQIAALRRELIWREFYAHIIYHFPHVIGNAFKKKYNKIKWNNNKIWFEKWCKGETGYALVDAGMKQLNETGWMHNRVRMIVAMFLTKDLLIDWRWGEKYFASKLVDYDPASNSGGWQWSASTGTDAQPYFRIFNPDLQIKKYDKDYQYIKKWNPDYKNKQAIVDHSERAKIAIKAFKAVF